MKPHSIIYDIVVCTAITMNTDLKLVNFMTNNKII